MPNKTLRTCKNGHQYIKSSDCPVCPICASNDKPNTGFLSKLSAPASRALLHEGIDTLEKLSQFKENEILKFHGMGPKSIPILKEELKAIGLSFKK